MLTGTDPLQYRGPHSLSILSDPSPNGAQTDTQLLGNRTGQAALVQPEQRLGVLEITRLRAASHDLT
jgi:hypothetical protein